MLGATVKTGDEVFRDGFGGGGIRRLNEFFSESPQGGRWHWLGAEIELEAERSRGFKHREQGDGSVLLIEDAANGGAMRADAFGETRHRDFFRFHFFPQGAGEGAFQSK